MPKLTSPKSIRELDVAYQIRLSGLDEQLDSSEKIYATAFKKLYYHLYSNSNSSRSEKIMSDLSRENSANDQRERRRRRRALVMTETELKLIAAAAIIGFSSSPSQG